MDEKAGKIGVGLVVLPTQLNGVSKVVSSDIGATIVECCLQDPTQGSG